MCKQCDSSLALASDDVQESYADVELREFEFVHMFLGCCYGALSGAAIKSTVNSLPLNSSRSATLMYA